MTLSGRVRGIGTVVSLLILLGFAATPAHATGGSEWFVNDAPSLRKVVDLRANEVPDRRNSDCSTRVNIDTTNHVSDRLCVVNTPFGEMSTNSKLWNGDMYMPVDWHTGITAFVPYASPDTILVSQQASTIGNKLGVYRKASKALLKTDHWAWGNTYYVDQYPTEYVVFPGTQKYIPLNTWNMAFSTNGEWALADSPGVGLIRIHMSDLSVQLFSAPIEPSWYSGNADIPMAITNDGRYAAANTDMFGDGDLTVYDLSTCTDQSLVNQDQRAYCKSRDIWNGSSKQGVVEQGLLAGKPGLNRPVHLRFVNNTTIQFTARYDTQDGSHYKVATFAMTAAGVPEHGLGLLGLGDSYISGQGAFVYREATDAGNNGCHLSELSYPFLLGKKYFNSYNSAACSGAVTRDVVQGLEQGINFDNYMGQVKDKFPESTRNKQHILATFLPGFIYQQEFASTYLPEAMLLSVGGDDIHFSKIIEACLANEGGGTCYDTYEDRAELVNQIDAIYPDLVETYTRLLQASAGARLYVVGYPQIVKADGDCGLNVHLNQKETELSEMLITYLNGVIKKAADTAGVYYVDTEDAFAGHELCEAGSKAVNGVTAGNDAGITVRGKSFTFLGNETYHPTALGYRLLADAIEKRTANLMAPMPTPTTYEMPWFNPGESILQDVPSSGRDIKAVTNDDHMMDPVVLRGDLQQVTVNGAWLQLQPGSAYQIVLHSDPVLLDEGGVNADGDISVAVHIPADVPAGYHTVHVYGTNMAGKPVDVQEVVYVLGSLDDYNGDGTPNTVNTCLYVPNSGVDADGDGTDDACDGEIGPVAAKATVNSTRATQAHGATASMQTSAAADATTTGSNAATGASDARGTVLGDTTIQPKTPAQVIATEVRKASLFYVQWLWVLGVLGVVTLAVACAWAMRQHLH